jgi:hypothetical protein
LVRIFSQHIQPLNRSVSIEEVVDDDDMPPNIAPAKNSQIMELSDGSDEEDDCPPLIDVEEDEDEEDDKDEEEPEESAEAELGQLHLNITIIY